ncbi:MAG: InlB B-repeat-containing protein, partial [Candidatus Izemoplasmatales bacterium]|nr:InlB B-repeat-containing protein [Candidatus Izemoplasmatales bacterium]
TGYTFAGWYSDIALTSAYVFSTMPASGITIYAGWAVVSVVSEHIKGNVISGIVNLIGQESLQGHGIEISVDIKMEPRESIDAFTNQMIRNLLDSILDSKKLSQFYLDINVFVQDSNLLIKQIVELDHVLTIQIEIPMEYRGHKNYGIIRVHNDQAEMIEVVYDDQNHTLTFETDKFSVYTIYYEEIQVISYWWILLVLILIPIAYLIVRKDKDEYTKQKYQVVLNISNK